MFGYLDCFSGVSGDKFLGALVSAGLHLSTLRDRLAALDLSGYELSERTVSRAGLAGCLVEVTATEEQPSRAWRTIRALIAGSRLSTAVRERSLAAFSLLAEAEATAHGVPVDEVHFHEVGSVDSIVDVVGASIGLAELGVEELWASPVRIGSGTVATQHGELPVPAPATAELLRGVPIYAGEVPGEMTTPTGAALLRAFVKRYAPLPPMRIETQGLGAGSRDDPIPNLLRLTLGHRTLGADDLEEVAVLTTVVDHLSAEHLAAAVDRIVEGGAIDAWATPVQMKKRRHGAEVTVLCAPADAARFSKLVMTETGTLGVRRSFTWRSVAERRAETIPTSFGDVRFKIAGSGDAARIRPENDDVVAIARATGTPVDLVAERLAAEARAALEPTD